MVRGVKQGGKLHFVRVAQHMVWSSHNSDPRLCPPAASPPPPRPEGLRADGHLLEPSHEHEPHKRGWSCMGTEMKLTRVARVTRAEHILIRGAKRQVG